MVTMRFMADLAALRGLTVHRQDQLVLVKSTGETYWFEAASTADDDSFLIVKPNDIAVNFAGRWKLVE